MEVGIIGLGKMGFNMALRLVKAGNRIVGYNRSPEKTAEAVREGVIGANSVEELVGKLPSPRIILVMVPAGSAVDEVIDVLTPLLKKGDLIVDGGNSFYKDAIKRAGSLKRSGIDFLDAGVSGGVWGLSVGYCVMAGGDKAAYERTLPVLKDLCAPGGYMHCGPTGAGHYVKMVHNGIEYGMMEAYAEGFELMKASGYGGKLDLGGIAGLWMNGSVVRSWLLELLASALSKDKELSSIIGYVEDSGEGRWMVKEAVDSGVELPVITEALFRRFRSRLDDSYAEKMLAALRLEFGGHIVKRPDK